jgi:T5SS/PEP-CTERM-associated repeat protein
MSRLSATYRITSRRSILFALFAAFSLAVPLASARADITPSGDVSPSSPPPINWTSLTTAHIGNTGSGTLTVDGNSGLLSGTASIGYGSGSTGAVTVDGAGSTWNNANSLYVGNSGSGTLSITNAGSVTAGDSIIGNNPGSTGLVIVDGSGSTLATVYRYGVSGGSLLVGDSGSGTLSISNGGSVSSGFCAGSISIGACGIGGHNSTGIVIVDGTGSTCTTTDVLVGGLWTTGEGGGYDSGHGTLTIAHGGTTVTSGRGLIGFGPNSGAVSVDGVGSAWICSDTICVGYYGSWANSPMAAGSQAETAWSGMRSERPV